MHLHAVTLLAPTAFYALLSLAGLGPCLLLLGREANRVQVAALAPVVGLCLALFAGTYAVQLDATMGAAALPLAAALIAFSAAAAVVALRLRRAAPGSRDNTALGPYLALLAVVAVLLAAPLLAGGMHATTLKGNLYDDLNYVIGARYLGAHPLSWQASASPTALLHTDPSFLLVKRFLWSERTPVLALLAWNAGLVGRPVIEIEYGFTLVFFLIAVGPATLLCLELGISRLGRALVAVAIACGFWAQIVLDLRAMGQIVNLPLTLALCWVCWRALARRPGALSPAGVALFALVLAAAALSYPEMTPSLAWGLGGTAVLACIGRSVDRALFRTATVGLLAALLLLATQQVFYWRLLLRQLYVSVVRASAMSWEGDWFRFLQTPSPAAGHWGLAWSPLLNSAASSGLLTAFALLLTLALVLALVRSLAGSLRRRNAQDPAFAALTVLTAFSTGFVAQDLAMRLLDNPWAGAKALTYGYPTIILLLAAWNSREASVAGVPSFLRRTLSLATLAWLLSQSAFAVLRIPEARSGATYFVYGDPSHRSASSVGYDPSWRSFKAPLDQAAGRVVWSFQPLVWESELFHVSFGDHARILPMLPVDHYESDFLIDRPDAAAMPTPDYLLVDRRFWGDALEPGEEVVFETARTRLIREPRGAWFRPRLLGILPLDGEPRLLPASASVAPVPIEVWVYVPNRATLACTLQATRPTQVVLRSSQSETDLWRGVVAGNKTVQVPLHAGLNVVRMVSPSRDAHLVNLDCRIDDRVVRLR